MEYIAYAHTPFREKFGIPRQSGLAPVRGEIVFEPKFRSPDAVRGIEDFSHLWLLWEFSGAVQKEFHATVAPPRLGGKEKRGVFATRSPFRPNSIGLSCVKLEGVRRDELLGTVLLVTGLDLLDGTPILDVKPYLPYADAHPEATNGFAECRAYQISVDFPAELLERIPADQREALVCVLQQDPRAAYNKKPDYVYGMAFGGFDVRFLVSDGVLRVLDVKKVRTDLKKVK